MSGLINGIGVKIEKIKPFLSPKKIIKLLTDKFCVIDDEKEINNCLKEKTQEKQIEKIGILFEECNNETFPEMVASAISENSFNEKRIPLQWAASNSGETYLFLEKLFPWEYNEWYKVPGDMESIKTQIAEEIIKVCSEKVCAKDIEDVIESVCIF